MKVALSLPKVSFKGLEERVLAVFVLVVAATSAAAWFLTGTNGSQAARASAGADVVAGARVFERMLELDTQRVIEGARVLTVDPAFRDLAAAGERAALDPMLARQAKRVDSALMLLVGADLRVVAGTLAEEVGRRVTYRKLLDRAAAAQQASGMVVVAGQLYQLGVVPMSAPQWTGWVVAGIKVNDTFAQELRNLTRLEVSVVGRFGDDPWRTFASTVTGPGRDALAKDVGAGRYARADSAGNAEYGNDAASRVVNLAPRSDDAMVAVLQRSLAPALEPFDHLQQNIAVAALIGVAAAIIAGMLLGRGIVGPVQQIAAAAKRIAAGDYSENVAVARGDEIGELATAFRRMQESVTASISKVTDLAYRDELTGLPTRALLADRLAQALVSGARSGTPVAVLILNIDGFGHINDTLGHGIGNMLLREVAARLRSGIRRATDSVARLGADEFALMLPGSRAADARPVAEAVLRALEVKMTLDGHQVNLRASLGIAAAPEHGTDPLKLLERADAAMHAAKRDKLRIAIWDERYDQDGGQRLALLADLRKAVENEELALTYQPKVALGEAGEHFVEALVRWQHPERGLVPPSEFVPLAEQTGYIRTVTHWVLAQAIAQCAQWRERGLPMNVSVNVSARDLVDGELPTRLAEVLEHEGCLAKWITLEITESALVGDPGHVVRNLERLHELGCRLAVDDYGTGNASLAYLRRLPLDELKIDKSCILRMATDPGDALVVRSTIDLARQLGLTVVAAGVEDDATLEKLRELECDCVQGFLVSRPLAADDVQSWVKESDWARAAREKGALRRVV